MPRTKAMTTVARELAKAHNPDQLMQLSELLQQEATKPRMDKRQYSRLQREVKTAYMKQSLAEQKLTEMLAEAGKTNDEINDEINDLRRQAERELSSGAVPTGRGRGRRKAAEATEA